jgi:PAS domain S-box-containing protein
MTDKPTVLYVDDERPNLTAFAWEFEPHYRVLVAESGEQALALLDEHDVQVVIADQRMPGMLGTDLLAHIRDTRPETVRMILTGYSDIDAVIDAINRGGVYHYFSKPWKGTELRLTIDHALEAIHLGDRADEAERRFRETFQQTSVGIAHLSLEGTRFVAVNQRFCELMGFSEKELLERGMADLTHPDELAASLELVGQLRRGEARTGVMQKRYLRRDGSRFWGRVNVATAHSSEEEPLYFIVVVQDIDDQKHTEDQLAELTENLEDLVRERSEQVLRQRAIHDRVMEMVVHDLKGPIAAIQSNSSYLLAELERQPEQREAVDDILTSAENLNRMVLDLLDVSKAGDKGIEALRRSTKLEAVMRGVVHGAEGTARITGHRLQVGVEPGLSSVDIDANLIGRLLQNLVDNAMKYAPAGSRVLLTASRPAEGQLRLIVSDSGPGVPESHRELIFEAYARLEDDDGAHHRTSRGLGLAFCRLAAQAHGGEIRCEAGPDGGARFVTELPV